MLCYTADLVLPPVRDVVWLLVWMNACEWLNAYWAQFYFVEFVIDVSEFCSLPAIGPGRMKAKLFPRFPLTWWWLEVPHSPGKIPCPCSSHYANNVNCILGCTGSSRAPCPSQRKENSPWGSPRLLWQRLHPTLLPSSPWPHCSSLSQALSASELVSFVLSIWACCLWPRQFVSNCSQSRPPSNLEPYLFPLCRTCARSFMGSFSLPCCCFETGPIKPVINSLLILLVY